MMAARIIANATLAGIHLRADGPHVRWRGPTGSMTDELRESLRVYKPAILAELAGSAGITPPCPSDVAERAAIIAEGDHCDSATADARALAEHGLPSWPALADLHRERILAELARLPPASSDHGRRLHGLTRAFLDSDHWQAAVALGWDLVEVFGLCPVAPLTRLDRQGLVPGIALSRLPGPRIVALEPGFAMIETRTGSRLRHEAGRLGPETGLWWRCPAIIGETT